MNAEERLCLECQTKLVGRRDKKFCDAACRSAHNNRTTSDGSLLVRKINRSLARNRRILVEKLKGSTTKAYKSDLEKEGFNFNYYTHIYTSKADKTYYYVYDYGYLLMSDKMLLIVRDSWSD